MRYFICLLLVMGSIEGFSESKSSLAEGLYDSGKYHEASEMYYRAIVEGEAPRHALLYNLANSYYMQGETAKSVASYLAARKFIPGNPELRANLKTALSKISDKVTAEYPAPAWARVFGFFTYFNPSLWLFGSSLLFFLSALMCLKFYYSNNRDYLFGMFGSLLVCFVLLGGSLFAKSFLVDWAAVGENNTTVYSGTSELSSKLFSLNAGAPVVVEKVHKGWAKVLISSGERGWTEEKKLINFNGLGEGK
jgi:tetratricopeptide (TPR) repeat protein